MNKMKFVNIVLVLAASLGIIINMYFEQYKIFGVVCIALMGVLGILKEKMVKSK